MSCMLNFKSWARYKYEIPASAQQLLIMAKDIYNSHPEVVSERYGQKYDGSMKSALLFAMGLGREEFNSELWRLANIFIRTVEITNDLRPHYIPEPETLYSRQLNNAIFDMAISLAISIAPGLKKDGTRIYKFDLGEKVRVICTGFDWQRETIGKIGAVCRTDLIPNKNNNRPIYGVFFTPPLKLLPDDCPMSFIAYNDIEIERAGVNNVSVSS